jgi:hypothetical protein
LVVVPNCSLELEIPSVKVDEEVEDLQFETWIPEMIQLAPFAGLEGLASPDVSYQESCRPHHENGPARRGRSPSPAQVP